MAGIRDLIASVATDTVSGLITQQTDYRADQVMQGQAGVFGEISEVSGTSLKLKVKDQNVNVVATTKVLRAKDPALAVGGRAM